MAPSSTPSSMNTATPWFGISMGLIGVIVGYSVGMGSVPFGANLAPSMPGAPTAAGGEDTLPAATGTAPETGVGPTLGNDSATVTIVEFSDFQCPFCGRNYEEVYPKIKEAYVDTGKVKYEFRHFPLGFHPNAMPAAEASMCAHAQGMFWEMHNKLFTGQEVWSNESDATGTFKKYADELDLDSADFASCMDNHETQALVQADMDAAGPAGVDGTPGFWIIGPNGQTKQVSGAYPYETFQQEFDTMLQ